MAAFCLALFAATPVFAQVNGENTEGELPPGTLPSDDTQPPEQTDTAQDGTQGEAPSTALNVAELKKRMTEEASSEIMSLKLGDTDVSLKVSGFWKGTLQGNLGIAFSPLGSQIVSQDSPVLFTQESELTLSLWMRDRWFVEANVLDKEKINTYRAGYRGFYGETVEYVGIGNTGLKFPSFPYLDLGGDAPTSFGYYGRFGGGPLKFHTLVRWDQAAREERTFVGGRERTYAHLSPDASVRGLSFVLPDTALDSEPVIFFEDEKGDLRDERGRRWRKAASTEYAVSRSSGLVELSQGRRGMVAAAYSKGGSPTPWTSSLGTYGDPTAVVPVAGSGFLGKVQDHFGDVKLGKYPQCGGNSQPQPGSRTIGGTAALVLYEPGTFSPFERRSRYEAPSSTSTDAALVTLSTQERVSGFNLTPVESVISSADIPLYASLEIKRGIYELVPERSGSRLDYRSPQRSFPLAHLYPEIYLPAAELFTGDLSLRFTSYGSEGLYSLGLDVVPESVQVWRTGIMDPQFTFNEKSGIVTLKNPAGLNEVIRIVYLRQSPETMLGSFAAGIGVVYKNEDNPFQSAFALGVRWNIPNEDSYTEEGVSNPGTLGLSAKTAWEYEHFKAQITTGLTYEIPDSTGLYRAAGMEENELVLESNAQNAFISHPPASLSGLNVSNRADLVYRNYQNPNTPGTVIMPIDWDGSRLITTENRPYPVKDSAFGKDTQVLAAEFTLDGEKTWTGFELPLGEEPEILARATEIEIPFRFYGFDREPSPADNFMLILQMGALAGKDFAFDENPNLILEKILFGDPLASPQTFNHEAKIARFVLDDTDRMKLADAKYLRLIAVHNGTGAQSIHGRVLLAPPILRGASWRPVTVKDNTVKSAPNVQSAEIREFGSDSLASSHYQDIIGRLHPSGTGQQILQIEWDNIDAGDSVGVDTRIGSLPLSNYQRLSFFVKGPIKSDGTGYDGGTLSVVIAEGPNSLGKSDEQYLEAEIPLDALEPGKWSKISICYQSGERVNTDGIDEGITVDDKKIAEGSFRYRRVPLNTSSQFSKGTQIPPGKGSYALFFISPETSGTLAPGNFCLDEIILEDSSPLYRFNGGARVEYELPGVFLSAGKTQILSDLALTSALESEISGDPFATEYEAGRALASRSTAAISVFGIKLAGNAALNFSNDAFFWNGGHAVSREWKKFSLKETFSAAPDSNSVGHKLNAAYTSAFRGKIDAETNSDEAHIERKWKFMLGYGSAITAAPPPAAATQTTPAATPPAASTPVTPPAAAATPAAPTPTVPATPPAATPQSGPPWIPSVEAETEAAWTFKNEKMTQDDHYGKMWVESWEPLLPDLGANAETRETKARMVIDEKTKPLGLKLSFESMTGYQEINELTRTGSTFRIEVPLTITTSTVNFKMERGFKRHLTFAGDDFTAEAGKLGEGIVDAGPLWKLIPLQALFTPETSETFNMALADSPSCDIAEYSRFNDLFGIDTQFAPFFDLRALYIPIKTSFSVERVLEQKLDTPTDILNLKGNLGFSGINMFGALGYKPLFKFYQTDSYTGALETAVAIPHDEDISWRLRWNAGVGFRGFSGAEMGVANTLTLSADGWVESFKLEWLSPVKRSLLSVFYDGVIKSIKPQSSWLTLVKLLETPYTPTRKENIELAFDYSGDYPKWSVILGHESGIKIEKRLNLSAFAKLNYTQSTETEVMSFIGTIGTTLHVFF